MVVMEYIDGVTLAVAKKDLDEETMKRVQSEVRRALKLLREHGFVFGDLRLPNIMVTKDGEVMIKLIDLTGQDKVAKLSTLRYYPGELLGRRASHLWP